MAPRDISSEQWKEMFYLIQDEYGQPVVDAEDENQNEEEAPECLFCDANNEHPIIPSCTCMQYAIFAHKLCLEAWINEDMITRSKCLSCHTEFPLKMQFKPITEVSQH